MYFLLLFLTWAIPSYSIVITARTEGEHNNIVQIYPALLPYHRYSCMCLTNINLGMTSYFNLNFTGLYQGSSLYLEINHPPYLEYQELIQGTDVNYSQIVQVNKFNTTGFETVLYFQETINSTKQEHWVYFTITNTTSKTESNLLITQVDYSYFIVVILTAVVTIFFGRFTKIYRFSTINIKWYYFLIYCFATTVYLIVLYFTSYFVGKYFQIVTVGFIGLISCYYYIQETIGACGFRYRIKKIYVRDVIAGTLAISIISVWIYFGSNWIMNNIIALFIIGTTIQVVKMSNLRTSLTFFVVILVFNISMLLVLTLTNFSIGYKIINEFPSPLELQIPTLDFFYTRRCTWIEITDMIFPGFLLNYARRIDISYDFSIYSVICYISIVVSAGTQMIIYRIVNFRVELPQAIFSIPLILILFFLVSSRRGQWPIIWHGGFYDKTTERTSLMRTVEWDRITQTLNEGLLIN